MLTTGRDVGRNETLSIAVENIDQCKLPREQFGTSHNKYVSHMAQKYCTIMSKRNSSKVPEDMDRVIHHNSSNNTRVSHSPWPTEKAAGLDLSWQNPTQELSSAVTEFHQQEAKRRLILTRVKGEKKEKGQTSPHPQRNVQYHPLKPSPKPICVS